MFGSLPCNVLLKTDLADTWKFLSGFKFLPLLIQRLILHIINAVFFQMIIHWTSMEEHLNGFRKSADFMPFLNLVKPFYNNIEEMKHYEVTPIEWNKE
jgi:hypothetical protein